MVNIYPLYVDTACAVYANAIAFVPHDVTAKKFNPSNLHTVLCMHDPLAAVIRSDDIPVLAP